MTKPSKSPKTKVIPAPRKGKVVLIHYPTVVVVSWKWETK